MKMSKPIAIEVWPLSKIVPYENNAKLHPPEQISKLARSILELGWDQPIVVDKNGVIIKGHGRRLAAMKLGLEKVPVVVRDDLTDEQVKASRLADNKVTSTQYDTDLLQLDISDLHSLDFDLTILGYDEKELDFLTTDLGAIDDSVLTGNLSQEVSKQVEANEKRLKEVDEEEVSLVKAFGFKTVPASAQKAIFQVLAEIESATGLEGGEALNALFKALVSDSRLEAILEGLS